MGRLDVKWAPFYSEAEISISASRSRASYAHPAPVTTNMPPRRAPAGSQQSEFIFVSGWDSL